jgi:hypothetical protein
MDFASEWAYVNNDDEEEVEIPAPPPAAAAADSRKADVANDLLFDMAPKAAAERAANFDFFEPPPAVPARAAPMAFNPFGGLAAAPAPPPTRFPIPVDKRKKKPVQPKVDVNVLSIKLGELATKADAELETGDPQYCSNCHGALVTSNHVLWYGDRDDGKKIEAFFDGAPKDEEVQKSFEEKKSALNEGEALWNCEFCGAFTTLTVDKEEIPKIAEGSLDYILEPPEIHEPGADAKVDADKEQSKRIIFCVDVSGSMCVSQQAPGSFKIKGKEATEDPFSFLPEDDPE